MFYGSVEAAQAGASERRAEGHSVFFVDYNSSDMDDLIEAVEEEGWSLEKMSYSDPSAWLLFRAV